jgi:hypothetical protein
MSMTEMIYVPKPTPVEQGYDGAAAGRVDEKRRRGAFAELTDHELNVWSCYAPEEAWTLSQQRDAARALAAAAPAPQPTKAAGPGTFERDLAFVIVAAVKPLIKRLDAAEARLSVIEQRPAGLAYRGVFDPNIGYAVGDVCTRSGSMWVSTLNENHAVPGDSAIGWVLSCKRGRDGKDLR